MDLSEEFNRYFKRVIIMAVYKSEICLHSNVLRPVKIMFMDIDDPLWIHI